ncbi:MAG: hypothetical protein HDT21_11825 [Ruminococcus sp.]|nr:hypothetical protein [Ruminococcus sp.]
MKIGEASRVYSAQMNKLNSQKNLLKAQKKAYEKGEIKMTEEQADKLAKSIDRIELQYQKASEFMEGFGTYKELLRNAESAKQQRDAMAEKAEEDAKCIEIMRRIAHGDKVPPYDEQKLLDYNAEMYQMAKNMALLAENEKRKEHDSLWDEDDEKPANEMSPDEVVDNTECSMVMPAEIMAEDFSAE